MTVQEPRSFTRHAPGAARPARAALAIGAAALIASGCSSYRPPTLEVSDVWVQNRTDEGIVLAIGLDAVNPNHVELPLTSIRYRVLLEGEEVFRGVRSPEATLRRLGTQRIVIPAAFPLAPDEAAPAGVTEYTVEGEIEYITPGSLGRVLFDLGVSRPSEGFREEGVATITAAPVE